jgi:hypothetical protein
VSYRKYSAHNRVAHFLRLRKCGGVAGDKLILNGPNTTESIKKRGENIVVGRYPTSKSALPQFLCLIENVQRQTDRIPLLGNNLHTMAYNRFPALISELLETLKRFSRGTIDRSDRNLHCFPGAWRDPAADARARANDSIAESSFY